MINMFRSWIKWINKKLEGEPGPQFLSGKGKKRADDTL